ncbi:MAG: hypothetical protein ACKV22_08795, partial [Bryobacteraceae bacterium]
MILKPFSIPMQDDPEMDTLQRLPFGEKFSFRWGPQAPGFDLGSGTQPTVVAVASGEGESGKPAVGFP